jgi:four helix bundle protein
MADPVTVPGRRQAVPAADPVPVPEPVLGPDSRWLDPERLDAYRVALEFQGLAAGICRRRGLGALRDQLDRASVSIVLNIAEGAGRVAPLEKAQFYSIARGSAAECGAALDLPRLRGFMPPPEHCKLRTLLVRIVSMLARLVRRHNCR